MSIALILALLFAYAPYVLIASILLIAVTIESAGWLLSFGTFMLIVGAIFSLKLTSIAAILAVLPALGIGLVLYVLIGVLYVRFYKWGSFIRSVKDQVDDIKESHPSYSLQDVYTEAQRHFRHKFSIPLRVREHKGSIMRWMGYWPVSILRTLLDDPLRRLYNHIYRWLASSMQEIADAALPAPPKQ